jgi:catechol 2,3-dioxygenase-like lactoylglutathione lyase family enzyme
MTWRGINHVHLIAEKDKVEETKEFYTDVMGFDLERIIKRPNGRNAMIFDDGTYSKLYFFYFEEDSPHTVKPKQQPSFGEKVSEQGGDIEKQEWFAGVHHVSWGVESQEEIEAVKEILEEKGIEHWGPINRHNFAYDLYFEDPNGVNLEIYSPGPNAGALGIWESWTPRGDLPEEPGEAVEVRQESDEILRSGSSSGIAKRLNTFGSEDE